MKKIFSVFIVLFIFGLSNFSYSQTNKKNINVMCSILPLVEFTEKVGKDKVDVFVMIPPGASPHTYETDPLKLKQLSKADIYIKVGSGIEFELVWMDKLIALNNKMIVCDVGKNIKLIDMKEDDHHHGGGEHKDPHTWLSPVNAVKMVENIRDVLMNVDSANKDFYFKNAEDFISELKKMDEYIKNKIVSLKNKSFIVFHPSWGYFADNYGLRQIAVEVEGKEPTGKELVELINTARKENIKIIFASPQFSRKSAEVI
ncbi:zinc ABC transporter substrate-binding protein, partial [bacterium]|nr:zinc ABC transporter substrate-binding protein [bacterium]